MAATTIAVANQKGGVGKTTIAMHVARFLALLGQRVVLVDMDPQANATVGLSSLTSAMKPGEFISHDLEQGIEPKAAGFCLLPSPGASRTITRTPRVDPTALDRTFDVLDQWASWIVVDCPPRIDDWGWAALCLADRILIPVQAEFFSLQGLTQAFRVVEQVSKVRGWPLEVQGVVINMADPAPLGAEVVADLRGHFGAKVLQTIIPRDSLFSEAASHGVTVWEHAATSLATRKMAALTREVCSG